MKSSHARVFLFQQQQDLAVLLAKAALVSKASQQLTLGTRSSDSLYVLKSLCYTVAI